MPLIVPFLQSEVNIINKQKFLAELGKLLTFMYEEDRQTALAMYVKMFEDAEDELALIQALVSPTRQAVIVARAYNAKERKLQVEAQTREQAGEAVDTGVTPDFVLAIHQVYQNAVPAKSDTAAPLEDQFSLFEEDMPAPEEEPAEEAEAAPEPAAEAEAPEVPEDEAEPIPETEEEPPAAEEPAEAPAAPEDKVDSFLADFAIADDELAREGEQELPPEEAPEDGGDEDDEDEPEEDEIPDAPDEDEVPEAFDEDDYDEDDEDDEDEDDEEERIVPTGTVRKAKPLLLILFLIIAIPLTLLGIAVLLIPTLLFLALALGVIAAGAATLMGAFSGFPVLADIMIVLGAALIILALGLLFLWIFIWFLGSVIGGLLRAVTALGAKWCYEEVPA